MKKTLIALAVLVAAGSVNAATVYDKDGVSFALSGDVDVNFKKDRAVDSADAAINLDDADFSFELGSAINEDAKAIGFFEFSGEGGEASTGDIYVGLNSASMGTVVWGSTATILDDAGIGSDYEFGLQGAIDAIDPSGDEVIKYKHSVGAVSFGIATKMDDEGTDTDAKYYDGMIGYAAGDFAGRVFVSSHDSDALEGTAYILEADYTVEDVLLQATYGASSEDTGAGDVDGSDDVNTFFVNVDYAIAAKATVYAEVGTSDADDVDTGYAVGMVVKF